MAEDFFAEYPHQTGIKHRILEAYLERWMAIQRFKKPGSKVTRFGYVDCFAGQGRHDSGQEGSPLIAMRIGEKIHTDPIGNATLSCLFIEKYTEIYDKLCQNVANSSSSYPSVSATPRLGTFQELQGEIKQFALQVDATLMFVDPFRYSDVPVDLVAGLLVRDKDELIVNFMDFWINRFLTDESKAATLDNIFKTQAWRNLTNAPDRQAALANLYGTQLQRFAQRPTYIYPMPVNREGSDQSAYHLLHASQHARGRQAIEEAVHDSKYLTELDLFLPSPQIQDKIVSTLRTCGPLSALSLAGEIWHDPGFSTVTWKPDIRDAIKNLEASNTIEIVRPPPKTRRKGSLPENTDVLKLKNPR